MAKIVTGLDIESTGLDWQEGDRIIELCMRVYDWDNRTCLINWTKRFDPEGRVMNAKAQKVHGISALDLKGCKPFKAYAPSIIKILERTSVLVTHNGHWFDIPFLAHELAKAGHDLPDGDVESVDTMQDGMFASYDTKPPSLRELCWAVGVEYDPSKAHAAEYDVDVMIQAFFAAVDAGYYEDLRNKMSREAA